MTPSLTPEQREAVERVRRIRSGEWRRAVYGFDWDIAEEHYYRDLLICRDIVLDVLTAPTCGTCGGTNVVGDVQRVAGGGIALGHVPCPECSGGKGE